jgi:3-methylcrotonyl-CoA carboxylase alpha subunit
LTPEIRESLGKKAVAAAKAVNYVGAGTVEFIMDADTQKFYFMEMNTRLQVEHPVTEMITGTDLVQWQLEVASGNRLPLLQDQLRVKGHSFEARIYAENPKNNFLPDTGTLVHLETPEPSDVVRVETGVRKGDTVSVYYDPMIAKLVVWGENREQALKKLRTELSQYQVVGLKTNIEFLLRLIENKGFIEGDLDTGFIKKYHSELFPPEAALSPTQLHSTVASLLLKDILSKKSKNPWDSPFALNSSPVRSLVFQEQEKDLEVECRISNDGILLELASESGTSSVTNFHLLASDDNSAKIRMNINEESKELTIVEKKDTIHVFSKDGNRWQLKKKSSSLDSARSGSSQSKSTGGDIKAPMPSKISQIMIKPGQQVKKGTPLVILEAMKMEHVMRAAQDGVVDKVRYNLNDLVQENEIIISFQKEEKK